MLPLPKLTLHLREWQEKDFVLFRVSEAKVSSIAKGAGTQSDKFKNACTRLQRSALQGNQSLESEISSSIDVRAFTYLLSSSDEFNHSIDLSRTLFDALLLSSPRMSKLSLIQLIRAFFVRYDLTAKSEILNDWCYFIKQQLRELELTSATNDLMTYTKNESILFSPSGPFSVVSFAKENSLDLDTALKRLGLTGFGGGRFLTLCRYQYYLDTLKSIPVGADDDILHEIVKKEVTSAPYENNRQLGHAILEILIDRSEGYPISQSWQNCILNIAGDPRVPKSSKSYQQWWSLLGEKRIALMRGWLSRFDLSLFLGILEQSAKDKGDADMERMFAPRKTFMEGLLDQRVVLESRLFLTRSAEEYLRYKYKKEDLPSYASVRGNAASVIYLKLDNDLHFIEGTHSFKIRIMNKLPSRNFRSSINDYDKNLYDWTEVGTGLAKSYLNDFGDDGGFLETPHSVGLIWQNKVIQYLRKFNIKLDVGKLFSSEQYRKYKERFGAG
jgi:hypothetical protein